MWEQQRPSEILCILGMHRSGSSALTRVMSLLGYGLPKTLIKDNASNRRGHWECRPIVQLNDAYLQDADLVWSDWQAGQLARMPASRKRDFENDLRAIISDEFVPDRPAVLKDPRMCRLMSQYRDAMQDSVPAKAIVILRNPLEIIASLAQRNDMSQVDAGLLWLRHAVDAVQGSRGMDRAFVTYDQLTRDPGGSIAAMAAALGRDFPVGYDHVKADIDSFLSPDLRSHAHSAEDVLHNDLTHGWISDVYQAGRVLCRDPDHAGALATIDDVATQFNASGRMLGYVARTLTQDAEAAERKAAALTANAELRKSQVEALRQHVEEAETRAAFEQDKAQADLAAAKQALHDEHTALQAAQAQVQQAAAAHKSLDKKWQKTRAELKQARKERNALADAADVAAAPTVAPDLSALEPLQQQIDALESVARKRSAQVALLKREVSQQKDVFLQLRGKFKALEKKAHELNSQRKDEKQRANAEEARAIRAEATAAKTQDLVNTQEATLETLWKRIEETERSLTDTETLRADLERHRDEILASTSWRVTGPVRAVLDFLRGAKRANAEEDQVTAVPVAASSTEMPDAVSTAPAAPPAPKEEVKADQDPSKPKTQDVPKAKPAAKADAKAPAIAKVSEPSPASGEDPDIAVIAKSPLFDAAYYLAEYPDSADFPGGPAAHYLAQGWRKGHNPSSRFVTRAYQHAHQDVLLDDVCPLVHLHHSYPKGTAPSEMVWHETGATPRIAVFSAISGGYDELKEPDCPYDGADFYLFTDGPKPPEGSVWQARPFEYVDADPVRTARFVKTHPHLYFGDYDFAIWMDANLTLRSDPRTLLPDPHDNHAISTWPHPLRDCIYDEGRICIDMDKDDKDTIKSVLDQLERDGYPAKAGMFETSVVVTNMQAPGVAAFFGKWWALLDQGSRRDQLSLPVVVNETGMELGQISHKRICMRSDPRVDYTGHKPAAE